MLADASLFTALVGCVDSGGVDAPGTACPDLTVGTPTSHDRIHDFSGGMSG